MSHFLIQVPAPIYDTIRMYNNSDSDANAVARDGRSKSLGTRLRSIFGKS